MTKGDGEGIVRWSGKADEDGVRVYRKMGERVGFVATWSECLKLKFQSLITYWRGGPLEHPNSVQIQLDNAVPLLRQVVFEGGNLLKAPF